MKGEAERRRLFQQHVLHRLAGGDHRQHVLDIGNLHVQQVRAVAVSVGRSEGDGPRCADPDQLPGVRARGGDRGGGDGEGGEDDDDDDVEFTCCRCSFSSSSVDECF